MSHTTGVYDQAVFQASFLKAAIAAGDIVMRAFGAHGAHALKADASPVTEADRQAEAAIKAHLASEFPDLPMVAEEAIADGEIPAELGRSFVLVDPLDGTREFIAGIGEFTVNIALVEDGRPVIGVVLVPASGEIFVGSRAGARKGWIERAGTGLPVLQPIAGRSLPAAPRIVVSRSRATTPEMEAFLANYPSAEINRVGSSLKFCRIAEGSADIYPCLGGTMEWDTAAGQAVLEASGGMVVSTDGGTLTYGKRHRPGLPDFSNSHFVASGPQGN